jgi:DNA invertase Pin-like site-specific DNA recombinase
LDNPELDTTIKHGKLLVGILSLIAEFEVDIKKERQLDGIAMAKERGVKFGRQPTVTEEDVRQMKSRRKQGALIRELQADYKLSKAHVYRLLAA